MNKIGIIGGAGRMGRWFAEMFVTRGFSVAVYDPHRKPCPFEEKVRWINSLRGLVEKSDLVIISTPPDTIPEILDAVKSYVRKGQAVVDMTTFKKRVIPHYQDYPLHCLVSSVHPLFGSGADIENLEKLVVLVVPVPGREGDSAVIKGFFKDLGFKTMVIDYNDHDEAVASMIGLSYVLGLATALYVEELDLERWEELSGTTFRLLLIHARSVLESSDSFISYIVTNDLVRKKTVLYMEKLCLIRAFRKASSNTLTRLRTELGGVKRIRRAYEAMYRALEHEETLE